MLLYLLQWLRNKHPEIEIITLSLYDGELSGQFNKVSNEYYELSGVTNPKQNPGQRLQKKIFRKLGFKYDQPDARKELITRLSQKDLDLVYCNTTVSLPLAQKIISLNKKARLIVHVHELESEIKRTIGGFDKYLNNIELLIAASGMVKNNLVENHRVPAGKIKVVYEFTRKLMPSGQDKKKEKVFRVGGSGKFGNRKGSDLFIQVARYLNDNFPELDIKFTWVGFIPKQDKVNLELELRKTGLSNKIEFVGEVDSPESYFDNFDAFLMTSREDPFPLVCIEAGMLGIPIICFDNATGTSEIIKDNGGYIVPYLNIEAMAEKIAFYYNNPGVWEEHSRFNKKEFAKFTADNQGEEIFRLLEEVLK